MSGERRCTVVDDDDDVVRCRWATYRDECGSVCHTLSSADASLNQVCLNECSQRMNWMRAPVRELEFANCSVRTSAQTAANQLRASADAHDQQRAV